MPDIVNAPVSGTVVPPTAARASGRARVLTIVWYVALCVLGLYFFNRHSIEAGGNLVFGDRGDSRFHMVTLEHWWRVVTGHDAFLSPNFFYPIPGVIGYSDLLALYGLFYIPLRAFGLDTYTSFQLTIGAVLAVSYWSMLLLLRRSVGVNPVLAGIFSLQFAFSGLKTMTFAETHMWSVAYVPFLIYFAIEYFRRAAEPASARMRYAVGFMVTFAALSLTSFYMAWFSALFAVLAAVATLALFCAQQGTANVVKEIRVWVVRNALHLVTISVFFVLVMVPFLLLYLPKSGQVERNNLGALPVLLQPMKLPYMGMVQLGLAFAVGIASIVWFRSLKSMKNIDSHWMIALCIAPALVASLVFLLPIGPTLWAGLYLYFPGGKYIRAPMRYYTFLTLPMMVLGSIGITKLLGRAKGIKSDVGEMVTISAAVLALLITVEQYKKGIPLYFDKSADLQWLARIPRPPAQCKSFAVTPGNQQQWYEKQLNGMVVAQRFDVPTLNGYSGTEPPAWTMMYPDRPGYLEGVQQWARMNSLEGVCLLDDQALTWAPLSGGGK